MGRETWRKAENDKNARLATAKGPLRDSCATARTRDRLAGEDEKTGGSRGKGDSDGGFRKEEDR